MRLTTILGFLAVSSSTMCFASNPVASITSAGALKLSGVRIDAGTVPSWPLVVGDEISTLDSSAVIVFNDKSRVLLGKNSSAIIGVDKGKMVLNMRQGDAVGLRQNAQLVVLQQGKRVELTQASVPPGKKFDFEVPNAQTPKMPGAPSKLPALSACKP